MDKYQQLLNLIKSKIEAHKEFKNAYNKQLAFDFNMLNFFNPGENKTSEILAFFLNPKQSHGQGDAFLVEFLKLVCGEEIPNTSNLEEVTCEKIIENSRRIDLYIKFKDRIIAIENKIWAIDQDKQISDYAEHLAKRKDNFLLLYLTPYGKPPSSESVEKTHLEKLEKNNNFKTISYTNEISILIDRWLTVCEADSVTYFLKQLKQYFKTKFLGNNTLNMTDNLKKIILENIDEVRTLSIVYKQIQNEIIDKINKIGNSVEIKLNEEKISFKRDRTLKDESGFHGVKFCISKDKKAIWVQLYEEKLKIKSTHYTENINEELNQLLNKDIILDDSKTDNDIIEIIIGEVTKAIAYLNK